MEMMMMKRRIMRRIKYKSDSETWGWETTQRQDAVKYVQGPGFNL